MSTSLGRLLIVGGVMLIIIGAVLVAAPKIPWLGRLPGDIIIHRENVSFYFPITTCLVISVVMSMIFWIFGRFRH